MLKDLLWKAAAVLVNEALQDNTTVEILKNQFPKKMKKLAEKGLDFDSLTIKNQEIITEFNKILNNSKEIENILGEINDFVNEIVELLIADLYFLNQEAKMVQIRTLKAQFNEDLKDLKSVAEKIIQKTTCHCPTLLNGHLNNCKFMIWRTGINS